MVRTCAIAAGLVAAVVTTLAAQQSVFRSDADLVHFTVTVTDKKGNVVRDLTVDDFEVLEEGKPQAISSFARGDDTSEVALHAGLLFDTSESMIKDLEIARTAAIGFLNRLPDAEDLTLVDFDTDVRLGRFTQDDFPRLVERIRSREPDGYTALYDAFAVYLDSAREQRGRTVLVAFTDGGDSRSEITFNDVLNTIRASGVTIYVVGLLENQYGSLKNESRLRLGRIAEEAGGQAIFPTSMKQIESAYDRILEELRGQYSLGYVSTDARRDGKWRDVRIRVTRPELKDLRVRTRHGYFAPR